MFLMLIWLAVGIEAATNPHGPVSINYCVNCIFNLMQQGYTKPGLLIFANTFNGSFMLTSIRNELLKKIHQSKKYVVLILTPDIDIGVCGQNDTYNISFVHMNQIEVIPLAEYYVLVIDEYSHFSELASNIVKSNHWNPHAKFIVFLIQVTLISREKSVETILSCLFKYNVINIVIAVPQVNNMRNAIIYSWRPYDPPKYCGNFDETAKNRLIIENICERGVIKYKKDIFYNKVPLNMQNCELSVIALERNPFISSDEHGPNIEKFVVANILKRFNFTAKYSFTNSFRGERSESKKWDGALNNVVSKQGHMLMGGIFPDFDVREDFECSIPYLSDSYTWVVPRAYPSPPWVALIIIFQKRVWYSFIAGFIFCAFTWMILGYLCGESNYNKALCHCFISTWISTLGFCAYVRPTKQSLRTFYIFFNVYCIIFTTAYQTKLIDVLQNPTSEEQIDTVEELVTSGLKFGGFEQLHDLFINSSDPFDNFIGREWTDVSNMTKAMIDVVVYRNFSVLCSRLELSYISSVLPELNDGFGSPTYFAFEKDMFSVPLEMISLRGFPFMKHISQTLNLYKQSGINEGVRRQFAASVIRKRTTLLLSVNKDQVKFKPLSVLHLEGGFLALATGAISGTLVLIVEIVWNNSIFKNRILSLYKKLHDVHRIYK